METEENCKTIVERKNESLQKGKKKTNSGYKHNKQVLHGILNLTFRMLQYTSLEVTVTRYDKD